jgi:mannose-6-phosphate isomerase-like protein (cupin superfamily)
MAGYVVNIEEATVNNEDYRRVLHTARNSQLVLMTLEPGEEIGLETHGLDQFIRLEAGQAKVILDSREHDVTADWAVVIPAGVRHNVVNTSRTEKLKLYTIYSPPEHPEGTVHRTKADADAAEHD